MLDIGLWKLQIISKAGSAIFLFFPNFSYFSYVFCIFFILSEKYSKIHQVQQTFQIILYLMHIFCILLDMSRPQIIYLDLSCILFLAYCAFFLHLTSYIFRNCIQLHPFCILWHNCAPYCKSYIILNIHIISKLPRA